jgi:lipoate-protein ligase A
VSSHEVEARASSGGAAIAWMSPAEYTRTDEEHLRSGAFGARVAILSERALSVGVGQPDDAACIRSAHRLRIPVIRRSTGGLGLLHAPGDLAWSLILPREDPRIGRDFTRAYARLGLGPVHLLGTLGVTGTWHPPIEAPGEYCLLSGRGDVLMVKGRAIGGAAQHLTRDGLLHHGILSWHIDPVPLGEVFALSPERVEQSLTSLDQVAGGRTPDELAERLTRALTDLLGRGLG